MLSEIMMKKMLRVVHQVPDFMKSRSTDDGRTDYTLDNRLIKDWQDLIANL